MRKGVRFWQVITDNTMKEKAQTKEELGKKLALRQPHS